MVDFEEIQSVIDEKLEQNMYSVDELISLSNELTNEYMSLQEQQHIIVNKLLDVQGLIIALSYKKRNQMKE